MRHLVRCFMVVGVNGVLMAGCASVRPQPVVGAPLPAPQTTVAAAAAAPAVEAGVAGFGVGQTLEVHFLDVGQGDSTLVRCPDGTTILVDAGSLAGLADQRKVDYLTTVRSLLGTPTGPKLDVLVVTHPDADHYNLLREALRDIPLSHVFYGGDLGDYGTFESWLQAFVSRGQATSPSSGYFDAPGLPNGMMECGDADVWILAANVAVPSSETGGSFISNSRSIVLRVSYGDFEAILTGDATEYTERAIVSSYAEEPDFLEVDLLKLGHHGSRATSNRREWIEAVRPRAAIASASFTNSYGHPSVDAFLLLPSTTDNLLKRHDLRWCVGRKVCGKSEVDEAIYSTPYAGHILVVSNGTGFQISCSKSGGC